MDMIADLYNQRAGRRLPLSHERQHRHSIPPPVCHRTHLCTPVSQKATERVGGDPAAGTHPTHVSVGVFAPLQGCWPLYHTAVRKTTARFGGLEGDPRHRTNRRTPPLSFQNRPSRGLPPRVPLRHYPPILRRLSSTSVCRALPRSAVLRCGPLRRAAAVRRGCVQRGAQPGCRRKKWL
jgi:hypothetical protein